MRTLILIGFFACLYLHFQSKDAEVEQLDVLSMKQASIKKSSASEAAPLPELTEIEPSQEVALDESSSVISDDDAQAMAEDGVDDISAIPWDEIEENWKTSLRDYLVSVDPEKAEEMLSAYLEEKKKYTDRVSFSTSENGVSQDDAASSEEPVIEGDGKEGEVERMHAENLKEIFGDHYDGVESLHKEFLESVQYLSRTSIKFSVSL